MLRWGSRTVSRIRQAVRGPLTDRMEQGGYGGNMAKGYAILRVEKIKTGGSLKAALLHLTRERTTLNADPERTKHNTLVFNQPSAGIFETEADRAYAYHKERIEGLRKRKDSVLALEYVVAASPDALDEKTMTAYLKDAARWINSRHPGAGVGLAIHMDETTPHMHMIVIPKTTIRDKHGHSYEALSARPYTGNSKLLSAMQTDFAEKVGKNYGLQRGIEGSVARHDQVKRAYGALARGPQQLPSKSLSQEDLKKYPSDKAELIDTVAREIKAMFVEAWGDRAAAAELEAENKKRDDRLKKREAKPKPQTSLPTPPQPAKQVEHDQGNCR